MPLPDLRAVSPPVLALAVAALAACGGTAVFAPSRTSSAQFSVSPDDRDPQSFELGLEEVVCRSEEEGTLLRVLLRPEELGGYGLLIDIKPFAAGAFDASNESGIGTGQSALECNAPCVSFLWRLEREQAHSHSTLPRCRAVVAEEHDGYLITFECLDMPGAPDHTADVDGEVFCSWEALDASAG